MSISPVDLVTKLRILFCPDLGLDILYNHKILDTYLGSKNWMFIRQSGM
jgi:hypothetical protein